MAQMIGDGPNRGKSAPSPRALPKPKPGGASDRLSREFTERIAERNRSAPTKRTPDAGDYTYPFWGPLLRNMQGAVRTGMERNAEATSRPPALAPRSKEAVQAYNRAETANQARKLNSTTTFDMYNNMAARQKKDEKRLSREARDRTETDSVLSESEWLALTPLQQAAAQANFDLDAAIKKDFKDQSKHTANAWQNKGSTERIEGYQDRVKALFGEEGASNFKGLEFAPNTLAFLESRGLDTKEELGGKTFDDIVSGDALIDEDTFAALGEKNLKTDPRGRNIAFAQSLAQGQLNYQEKLAEQLKRGDQLLGDVTGRTTNAQAGAQYGANALPAHAKMTAVRPEMLGQIDKYMEILARPDIPLEESLPSIKTDLSGLDKKEAAQIWENMIERTRQATTGEAQWFDDVDFEMRKPDEVAKILGAPTLKRAGAK